MRKVGSIIWVENTIHLVMKSLISSCNITEILYNIDVPGNLNAYSIGNPMYFPVNKYNIFTSITMVPEIKSNENWWMAFWQNVWNWGNTISGLLNPVSKFTAIASVTVALFSESGRAGLKENWDSGALNPFNQDAEIALNAKVLSFYKGSTVVRQDIVDTFSMFGTIWLKGRNSEIDLKHEWGHSVQERMLGIPLYTSWVAIPSVYYNQTGVYLYTSNPTRDRMYYSKIWERTADWLGGVNRKNYDPFWSLSNFIPW